MSAILRVSLQTKILQKCVISCERTSVANISKSNVLKARVDPFSMKGLLKHYELLPLVVIVGAGTIGLGAYGVYFCNTRNDVQFRKQTSLNEMDLQKPPVLKMVKTIDYREYKPLTQLEELYKEMAEASNSNSQMELEESNKKK